MLWPKSARLAEFLRRLREAGPCSRTEDTRALIETTLNAVEDEMTNIPFNPATWQTDGRLYPAQDDSIVDVPGVPDVLAFRHVAHRTFIGPNGSFEIQTLDGRVLITKPGVDGDHVWDCAKETE